MIQKTAILLGATGLTGSLLLKRLIKDESYSRILLFSRKSSGSSSPKVKEFLGDVLHMEEFKQDFLADEVYVCIGTTSAKTKDKELYRAIDYGIPTRAAILAKEHTIPTFVVMSSMGANPGSRIFYSRTKGEMEETILSQEIPNTYILRPSLILGERNEKRFGESFGAVVLKASSALMVGKLKKYRAIKADHIAAAMIRLAKTKPDMKIIESDLIQELASSQDN